jgi:hypothetical protein
MEKDNACGNEKDNITAVESNGEISGICQRLKSNDPSLLRLDLVEPAVIHCSPSFDVFLEALIDNYTVKTVHVGELLVRCTQEEILGTLLEGLGALQGLQALEVAQPVINAPSRIMGEALSTFLRRAKNLQMLVVWSFVFLNNDESVQLVADAVRDHPSLQTVALMHLLLGNHQEQNDNDNDNVHVTTLTTIDPLLYSIATVTSLTTLHLVSGIRVVSQDNSQILSAESLSSFLRQGGRLLHTLVLRNWGMTDEHCRVLAEALLSTTQEDTTCTTVLRIMDLRFNLFTATGYQVLADMMKDNTSLECLEIDITNDSKLQRQEIEFHLALNRAGRGVFFKDQATKGERVDCLIRANEDLDVLYYLLSRNPSVCEH